ncbi:O-acetyl-ADP-ribose deacetylase [Paenibacillus alginolyticus]|uniref:O-acetyl-ADP-ribose deacetylase n=1 Tax=Paenibacillus alginolyticus TaxID=59839 RepID=A0ABT4GF01_9BACL|nr:O-acetyl-ADP-ribose deacetylase [Paenibacillus alginolyticus]MCY9694767.1 O-acetyl-ADP-ribose deacetylase [Paenibacillus alginolyticus]MEC0147061.1 O-acetyl-ADP-ribose deacetylase [Paenibacillus alginolyticus]
MEVMIDKTLIQLVQGDITKLEVDAIVNAANTSLMGGGGVDGAIHKAGGKAILEDCIKIRNQRGGCAVGEAVITTGGNMKCRIVIHTVGPVWNSGANNEEEKLRNCYKNTLTLAEYNQVTSVAIPSISTGIYKYPKELAAGIALNEISKYIVNTSTRINKIVFVSFDEVNYEIYKNKLKGIC